METDRSVIIPELSDESLRAIDRIGHFRYPSEACGLLLMSPHKGRSVIELPNRSLHAHTSYIFNGDDARIELAEYEGDVIIWHTHPAGGVGPSRDDMKARHPDFWYLVVALTDKGPVPTFF